MLNMCLIVFLLIIALASGGHDGTIFNFSVDVLSREELDLDASLYLHICVPYTAKCSRDDHDLYLNMTLSDWKFMVDQPIPCGTNRAFTLLKNVRLTYDDLSELMGHLSSSISFSHSVDMQFPLVVIYQVQCLDVLEKHYRWAMGEC